MNAKQIGENNKRFKRNVHTLGVFRFCLLLSEMVLQFWPHVRCFSYLIETVSFRGAFQSIGGHCVHFIHIHTYVFHGLVLLEKKKSFGVGNLIRIRVCAFAIS